MTDQVPDLSRLKISRDDPSPSSQRALKRNAFLAVVAVVSVAFVFLWIRGVGGVEGRPSYNRLTRCDL